MRREVFRVDVVGVDVVRLDECGQALAQTLDRQAVLGVDAGGARDRTCGRARARPPHGTCARRRRGGSRARSPARPGGSRRIGAAGVAVHAGRADVDPARGAVLRRLRDPPGPVAARSRGACVRRTGPRSGARCSGRWRRCWGAARDRPSSARDREAVAPHRGAGGRRPAPRSRHCAARRPTRAAHHADHAQTVLAMAGEQLPREPGTDVAATDHQQGRAAKAPGQRAIMWGLTH